MLSIGLRLTRCFGASGSVFLEPSLSRIRIRLNSFEPRLGLSLLSLKSLYTKFPLNLQLFNIYLLLYNKKHIAKFWTAFILNYATLKLKITGLDSGSRFKYRLKAQGSGSRFSSLWTTLIMTYNLLNKFNFDNILDFIFTSFNTLNLNYLKL
jgi:hypothetical protein